MVSEFAKTVLEYLETELATAAADEREDLLRKASALLELDDADLKADAEPAGRH